MILARDLIYTAACTRVARSTFLVSATNYELAGAVFRPAAGLLLMSALVKIAKKEGKNCNARSIDPRARECA